jgi:hypothetical protein
MDEERERVRAEARMENRIANLETEVQEMKDQWKWIFRAIWGGAAYLAMQVWEFVSSGGALK